MAAFDFDVWSYVARLGTQMRGAADDFFAEGDSVCAMRSCQYLTQEDCEEFLHKDYETFSCSVPGCSAKFKQLIDNEAHYNAKHRHACSVCKKSQPSAHLLELHVVENHDSYFEVLAKKKPSYECFMQTCKDKFWNPQERKQHCLQCHSFPDDFAAFESVNAKTEERKKSRTATTSTTSSSTASRARSSHVRQQLQVDQPMKDCDIVDSRKAKAGSLSPKEVRRRGHPRKKTATGRPRPKSVFDVHAQVEMEIGAAEQESRSLEARRASLVPKPVSTTPNSKLPTYQRRFSLTPSATGNHDRSSKNAKTKNNITTLSPVSPPPLPMFTTSPVETKREPLSLAKMGARLTCAASSSDVSSILNSAGASASSSSSSSRQNFNSSTAINNYSSLTSTVTSATVELSPRKVSGIPRKMSSKSSSMGSTGSRGECESPNARNGNSLDDSSNNNGSPSRIGVGSKIPVRTSSVKLPKTICFGLGANRSFQKNWFARRSSSNEMEAAGSTMTSIEDSNYDDMRMALD